MLVVQKIAKPLPVGVELCFYIYNTQTRKHIKDVVCLT